MNEYKTHTCNEISLEDELNMIDVNIKAVHILTRMFLKNMTQRNSGYILNVASSAGLLKGGPLMSTYYATKSYVYKLTEAINYEVKKKKSNVKKRILFFNNFCIFYITFSIINYTIRLFRCKLIWVLTKL